MRSQSTWRRTVFVIASILTMASWTAAQQRPTDCSGNGEVIEFVVDDDTGNGTTTYRECRCDDQYATYPDEPTEENIESQCSYKRKSEVGAIVLQVLLGEFGAMRFYLGYTGLGLGQLFLLIGPCILGCLLTCCVMACCGEEDDSKYITGCGGCIFAMCAIGVTVWWIYDIVQVAQGLPDANGVDTA